MKYYYGNSYKEAVSNNPVEINDTSTLKQYRATYDIVIEYDEAVATEDKKVVIAIRDGFVSDVLFNKDGEGCQIFDFFGLDFDQADELETELDMLKYTGKFEILY